MKTRKYYLFILLLLKSFTGFAQNQSFNFEHMGTHEGLSQINVLSIFQDSRGFIWVGTTDGLNRYDGYNFAIYRSDAKDNTAITGNYVNDITEDKEGNLWVALCLTGSFSSEVKFSGEVVFPTPPGNRESPVKRWGWPAGSR